ncbi:MAG: hypothetical protein ACNA71_05845, partial [Kiritimatiellia bacterium]
MRQFVFLAIIATIISVTAMNLTASQFGIGLDIIRIVDKNQDDGMANIHAQIGLSSDTALTLGYARGDNLLILET